MEPARVSRYSGRGEPVPTAMEEQYKANRGGGSCSFARAQGLWVLAVKSRGSGSGTLPVRT